MFQNHWDGPWVILSPTLPLLYFDAWLNTISLLLRELFTAINSSQLTPHHSTPGGERASLILSTFLSSQIIHSRVKSQSLSLSFSVCLYGSVGLPGAPLYYSPLVFHDLPA